MSEVRRGTAYGVAAYLIWGLFPLYFPLLEPATPVEVLAHRVLWSLLLVGVLLQVTRGLGVIRDTGRSSLLRLSLAGLLLGLNWGTYIYGVNTGQVVETSLGYFITPLVSMALGVVVLGERLRPAQQAAVGLGAVAVLVLAVDNGGPPWIALLLASSFGCYGLLKKQAGAGASVSLTVETLVMAPLAVAYLAVLPAHGTFTFTAHGTGHALLLASTGLVTAVPLLAFGAAANRVPLTTIGLMQYIAPVLQLLIGVLVRDEPFSGLRAVGFALVWLALAGFTADLLAERRRQAALVVTPVG